MHLTHAVSSHLQMSFREHECWNLIAHTKFICIIMNFVPELPFHLFRFSLSYTYTMVSFLLSSLSLSLSLSILLYLFRYITCICDFLARLLHHHGSSWWTMKWSCCIINQILFSDTSIAVEMWSDLCRICQKTQNMIN